ncbi:hypothetical protein [Achromobacter aegrifaciens]|uniref:hypothetical protein n=1 Tax=Achromobacter aegrifaciens TaxID=1287736 RepID=UPI000F735DD7|nr:hypothetical protein [Achromobacter aegrifaciens]RSE88179.1 hypothetical protein EGU54_33560 [Achromobacter aegrifaciens]
MTPIPAGWKLVPIEPTPEMLEAARRAPLPAVMMDSRSATEDLQHKAAYAAMLAAAPSPASVAPGDAQDEKITPADAVYGLMAWLSGRDEIVTLSARHGAAIAAELANAFCTANGLEQFSPGYPDNLKYPSTDLAQPAAPAAGDALDAELERHIDGLRLKAFRTNAPDDRRAYFEAVSKWFQERDYRALRQERRLRSGECE